jgi:glycosyltransferase involved in cell wall biosynthesis
MHLANELTIIVPTRNEAANIRGFLASIPPTIAVIIVDHSRDDTLEIARRSRTARLTLLECVGSLTEARQLGAEHAVTRWLLFTDADVAFAPGYFERLARLLSRETGRGGLSRFRPSHRGRSRGNHAPAMLYGPKLSRDAYAGHYARLATAQRLVDALGIPAASGSNMIVSAESFAAVGGFDVRLTCNEDSELGWRIARAGFGWHFDRRLVVWAKDHRRLDLGRLRKTLHTVLRCSALYLDLVPQRWRTHDWGYWAAAPRPPKPRLDLVRGPRP